MACSTDSPIGCAARKRAMFEGRVWYSWQGGAWFWLWDGVPTLVTHCIYCGNPLPQMGPIMKRVLRGDAPWDVEEGG